MISLQTDYTLQVTYLYICRISALLMLIFPLAAATFNTSSEFWSERLEQTHDQSGAVLPNDFLSIRFLLVCFVLFFFLALYNLYGCN